MRNENHLLRIVSLIHRDSAGNVLLEKSEILNMFHFSGERFMLGALFSGLSLPLFYYLGLDSRGSLSKSDVIGDINGLEPSSNGYERQSVASVGFSLSAAGSGSWRATGPIVLFRASGGSWGPVSNIFMCTGLGYGSSTLISSVPIGQNLIVQDGETITMKMAMSLSGC
jgi:hypothetical protein